MNVEAAELKKFADIAHHWWDMDGAFKPLHEINPLRLRWIAHHASLSAASALDIGCGGGILSESLSAQGAEVTGIDLADKALKVASLHALQSGVKVDYRLISAEQLASEQPASFDVVCCMEMLEHVPRPASIVDAAARLVRPGGWVFFSTINRNAKAFLLAILGAEYLLRLLPMGTHTYAKFIKPSELASWARASGLDPVEFKGLEFDPLDRTFRLGSSVDVNYFLACRRPA